jgi:hypothetical protein
MAAQDVDEEPERADGTTASRFTVPTATSV